MKLIKNIRKNTIIIILITILVMIMVLKDDFKDDNRLNRIKLIKENATIYFTYQEKPLGTGHALMLAEDFVDGEDFAILWGDDLIKSKVPVLKQLIDSYNSHSGNIVGVQKVEPSKVSKYGIVKFKDSDTLEIETIIEKPKFEETPSFYAGLGRYIVSAKIFDELRSIRENNGEFYFTDALSNLINYQKSYACIFEGKYYDIGSQVGYIVANIEFGLERDDVKNELTRYFRTGKF